MSVVEHATVEVPASCANLGPGFDTLAAAVDVTMTVRTTDRTDGARMVLRGEGAGELPTDDSNLVWRAFAAYFDWAGAAVPDVALEADSAIPLERGLGSSAAAAVAGVVLGRAIAGGAGHDAELVELAARFDGHADNVAAALHGGLVIVADGQARLLCPSEGLRPVVCVPAHRQSTRSARALLPETVTLAHAAGNGGRAALVAAGLSGAADLDVDAMRDVLHEPARFGVMPASGELVAALRADGVAACLSGAGPSVLAVVRATDPAAVARVGELAGDDWQVDGRGWHRAGAWSGPRPVGTG